MFTDMILLFLFVGQWQGQLCRDFTFFAKVLLPSSASMVHISYFLSHMYPLQQFMIFYGGHGNKIFV